MPSAPSLHIEIREEIARFHADELTRWKDPRWWRAGHWKNVLPEAEWPRYAKFRNQAAKPDDGADGSKPPRSGKGRGLEGYHFVEVQQMRALPAGYRWRYESYALFADPGPGAPEFRPGYEIACRAFGGVKMAALRSAFEKYRPTDEDKWLAVPDLFVYREDGDRIADCQFIECKRNDKLSEPQLLALALIKSVLQVPVRIVRYVPEGKHQEPKIHRGEFPARTMSPGDDATAKMRHRQRP